MILPANNILYVSFLNLLNILIQNIQAVPTPVFLSFTNKTNSYQVVI